MQGPLVSVLMGSDSDLPVMRDAVELLEKLEISCEVKIASAHRTPEDVKDFAEEASERGIKVIIVGAGGAAHLPGVVAAYTVLPVIGVPVSSVLNGVDSLYSIVQMPKGIPVATMAVDGAQNAGIFAAHILALNSEKIHNNLMEFRRELAGKVRLKNDSLQKKGIDSYLREK